MTDAATVCSKQRVYLEHGGGWTDAATVCSKQRVYLEEGGGVTDAATVCSKQRVYLEEGGGVTDAATVCSKQRVYLEEGGVLFYSSCVQNSDFTQSRAVSLHTTAILRTTTSLRARWSLYTQLF